MLMSSSASSKSSLFEVITVNGATRHGAPAIIVPGPTNILSIRDRGVHCVIFERFASNTAGCTRSGPASGGHLVNTC